MQKINCEVGIIGGSGFYDFFLNGTKINIKTPFGEPSSPITISEIAGQKIAFLARHGEGHKYPPHRIPYKANIYAFKKIGIKRIIAPTASGSLKAKIRPGDFVLCDSFVDKTHARQDTFYEGINKVNKIIKHQLVHISSVKPYCPDLKNLVVVAAKKSKIPIHTKETVVVINGPRFASDSESREFQKSGYGVINMTQYPEVILARELSMCYLNISLITDYDAGLKGKPNIQPVNANQVIKLFNKNLYKLKNLIAKIITSDLNKYYCKCHNSLEGAVLR